jgi:hypothetical protein
MKKPIDWRPIALETTTTALLLVSAIQLYGMGSLGYHPYSYYQIGRVVACAAWVLTAYLFWRYKATPLAVIAVVVAYIFNPIVPLHMRRYQWPPYDHAGALASLVAAALLAYLTMARLRKEHVPTDDTPV